MQCHFKACAPFRAKALLFSYFTFMSTWLTCGGWTLANPIAAGAGCWAWLWESDSIVLDVPHIGGMIVADASCPDTRRLSPQKNQRLDALSPAFVFGGSCRQSKDACLQPVPHHTMGFYITYLQADGWPKLYDNVWRERLLWTAEGGGGGFALHCLFCRGCPVHPRVSGVNHWTLLIYKQIII